MNCLVKRASLTIFILLCITANAFAKIDKIAVPSSQGFQLYWYPCLPILTGWQHDDGASQKYAANVLVPRGYSFSKAPAVIYGEAIYKPGVPDTTSVAQLILNDRAGFKRSFPGLRIKELPNVHDGDGKAIRLFSFFPQTTGSWETVAYSEEGKFFLIFTVSAKTSRALQAASPAFDFLVSQYRANP